jgi:cold shock CspA family protein/ribosome-associated translation inhibitor RaiA
MRVPLQVTFRHVDRSDEVEVRIRERAEKLDRICGQIMTGRVVVDLPAQRHRKGKVFLVRIDLTVPGKELVVNRDPLLNHAHEDVYVAVEDAFDAMERILKEYSKAIQGEVKRDVVQDRGLVDRIFPEEGYGFIQTSDGRDIYFHRNSVLNGGFDRLRPGAGVRFKEEDGEKGPQASTVDITGTT